MVSAIAATSLVAFTGCGGEASAPAGDSAAAPDTGASAASSAPEAGSAPAPAVEATPVAFADLTGDAAKGEKVFIRCSSCHVLEEGQNRVGPHLYGVVGRSAGSVEGFNYSPANAGSGITWTPEILFDYLEAPQTYLKGTRMAFPGIKDPQERADLIAYLEANGEV
jgi:cytochrome c